MRISDWSSDVCSSDLALSAHSYQARKKNELDAFRLIRRDCPTFGRPGPETFVQNLAPCFGSAGRCPLLRQLGWVPIGCGSSSELLASSLRRSEEHTSELQSLMRISYAVFSLKKK